ncbi:MAG: response regulator [Gammaproteobacteria bacterium]|nr:MAG: response regulator [Gammaproteobacteria bacterium]
MANRLALIVDDSKTARVTLKRMLEKQGLDVATLESAPEALDYLVNNTPDVIFMDHMMPDMDGFEAVEAIKNNPDTATIPIMMYTSKGGDLYVSQARALGAVGILPKQVQPAALFEVLNSLGLVKDRRARAVSKSERAVMMEPAPVAGSLADSGDMQEIARQAAVTVEHTQELHSQFGDLLIQHNSVIEEDLSEIKHSLAQLTGSAAGGRSALSQLYRTGLFIPLVVLLVMLIPLIWLYKINNETQLKLDIARNQAARLQASVQQLGQNRVVTAPAAQTVIEEPPPGRQPAELYQSIAWAVNLGGHYDVREEAFGDRQLAIVYELITRLTALDFKGVVRLESHLGEFCLSGNEVDGFVLAGGNILVRECSRFGHPLQQLPLLGERQSIAFANFLATSPLVNGSDIQIEIVAHGYSRPHLKYPARESGLPASEWNRIAAANNRVDVILGPAGG